MLNLKKVLLFVPTNGGTTIAGISLNLYHALRVRNDLEVKVVLIYKYDDGRFDFGDCAYFATSEAGSQVGMLLQKIKWLRKIKKEFKPDITISTLFICSIISVLSGRNDKKVGIFHSPHSQVALKGKIALFSSYCTYKFIYPKLDKLCCVSSEIKESIAHSFKNIPAEKLKVVYNIHNIDEISQRSNDAIDEEVQSVFDEKVILFCGRLDINKAPQRLLNAFVKSLNELPANTKLVFIGKDADNLWNEMQQFAKNQHIENRVFYLGEQTNPYKYMKAASVLISTSYSEGLPGVLIETLILRTPVISTNSSKGVWEILSVEEKYDKMLTSNFITKYGIITSNNAHYNKDYENADIENLSEAIITFFGNEIRFNEFEFESKINETEIINALID